MNSAILTTESLLACCGSHLWVQRMLASSPASSMNQLHEKADTIWWSLPPEAWLEACAAHPQIGQESKARWSAQEQAGMSSASSQTTTTLLKLNQEYRDKFGFIFIVCATGKTGDEMRQLLEQRIHNTPEAELRIAAEEQAKIMHLRLDKLLAE